jgi:putative ABC transport system permease protein
MGWILSGLDSAMMDTFKIIGVDMLYVDKWDWSGGKHWKELRQRKPITMDQTDEFQERIKAAELTFASARNWGASIKYDNETFQGIAIVGTESAHARTPAGDILVGRHFTPYEERIGSNVVVLGYNVYNTIFPEGNAIDKTIKINGHKFNVAGVITKQGTMFFDFIDNQVFIPLTTFNSVMGNFGRSFSIAVKAGSEERLDYVRSQTRGHMRMIRNLDPWEEDDFSINETKAFESTVKEIRYVVWGVGIGMTVLSFMVGIIGIMNIMFVSVTERTKEIGIRKAIGAKKRSILLQFIVEAATLSFVGAIIAFVGCSALVYLVATLVPKAVPELSFLSPMIPYQLLLIASVVSIIVGMLAGLIPAIRASNLDPVDALRYE